MELERTALSGGQANIYNAELLERVRVKALADLDTLRTSRQQVPTVHTLRMTDVGDIQIGEYLAGHGRPQ